MSAHPTGLSLQRVLADRRERVLNSLFPLQTMVPSALILTTVGFAGDVADSPAVTHPAPLQQLAALVHRRW